MRPAIAGLAAFLAVLPFVTPPAAQAQAKRLPRVGILVPVSVSGLPPFTQELRQLGHVEGQSVALEIRGAEGKPERFPGFAAELVRLKVDVILAVGDPAIAAARKATPSIPIVMVTAADPVAFGFVANLSRPGGNVTGLSFQSLDLSGKRLELLKEATPTLSRLAVLWDPDDRGARQGLGLVEAAARTLGVQAQVAEVRSPGELEGAFVAASRAQAGAAYILGSIMMFSQRARIAELAVKHRLPTVCGALLAYVEAGCLIGYGPTIADQFQRAAHFVDRILKGARPADLPIEQPTKFHLAINLKTARALRLAIPQSLLLRADQLIDQ